MATATTPVGLAMAMATSDSARSASVRGVIVAAGLITAMLASACGSASSAGSAATGGHVVSAGALASLRTQAAPHGWRPVRLSAGGAALAAPPGWRRVSGDPGSATFVLGASANHPRAYLNATPATDEERLGSWVGFRLSHNRDEGDRNVRLLATRGELRLGGDVAARCMQDAYISGTTDYTEIACLAQAASGRTVIVAASPTPAWPQQRATLMRAIDAVEAA
jgi:hypothetical protein